MSTCPRQRVFLCGGGTSCSFASSIISLKVVKESFPRTGSRSAKPTWLSVATRMRIVFAAAGKSERVRDVWGYRVRVQERELLLFVAS